jgi:hypothetical protein
LGDIISQDNEKNDQNEVNNADVLKRGQRLPASAVKILKKWRKEKFKSRNPDENERVEISLDSGLSIKQVKNWFNNNSKKTGRVEKTRKRVQALDEVT